MASNKGVKPHYYFHAMHKVTDEKSRIGSAWRNEDGSISISLNSFVVLNSEPDLFLRLFPNTNDYSSTARPEGSTVPPDEDDIPF